MTSRLHVVGSLLLTGAWLVALPRGWGTEPAREPSPIVTANNPEPVRLPMLTVWQDESLSRGQKLTMVAAAFPNVPGLICDSWCYESELDFITAKALDGGKLELSHRVRAAPQDSAGWAVGR